MDSSRFFAILNRSRWLLLAGCLIAAAAGWVASLALPRSYESEAVVLVGSALSVANAEAGLLEASQRLAETYARVATTRPLLQRVIDKTSLKLAAEDLVERVSVTTPREPPIITVRVVLGDPSQAAAVSNAVVAELVDLSPGGNTDTQAFIERQLRAIEQEVETLNAELEALLQVTEPTVAQERRIVDLQLLVTEQQAAYAALLDEASQPANNTLTVLEVGIARDEPISPRPLLNALIAAFVGLLFGVLAALIGDHLGRRVQPADDIERSTNVSMVGESRPSHGAD